MDSWFKRTKIRVSAKKEIIAGFLSIILDSVDVIIKNCNQLRNIFYEYKLNSENLLIESGKLSFLKHLVIDLHHILPLTLHNDSNVTPTIQSTSSAPR